MDSNETQTDKGDIEGRHSMVPVLPLRDVVVYPHMVIPLFVGRERSIRALDEAMSDNKQILLVAQQSAELDEPVATISIESEHCRQSCSY
jgi:ATP-dependent Lon protease